MATLQPHANECSPERASYPMHQTTSSATASTAPTERSRVRRVAENARYDADSLHAIIDAAYLCQIAFVDGKGVHCIPTACWREGEHLYVHGSNGGRLIKLLAQGQQTCVSITLLDGLVLARAAFNHSMNYRSCVIYGQFEALTEDADKRASMDAFMNKIAPGRQHQARPGNDKEFAATTILRIALTEAACKVRSGPPQDDAEDMDLQVWAGELPFVAQWQAAPIADALNQAQTPDYVRQWAAR